MFSSQIVIQGAPEVETRKTILYICTILHSVSQKFPSFCYKNYIVSAIFVPIAKISL